MAFWSSGLRRHCCQPTRCFSAAAAARYSLLCKIGEGSFATVHRATDRETGSVCAVKTVEKSLAARFKGLEVAIEMETELMRRAGEHQHIVNLLDSFETPTEWNIVLELAPGGDVFDRWASAGPYSEADASRLVRQAAHALAHLHGANICHRDVKPDNLLLASDSPSARGCTSTPHPTGASLRAYCVPYLAARCSLPADHCSLLTRHPLPRRPTSSSATLVPASLLIFSTSPGAS